MQAELCLEGNGVWYTCTVQYCDSMLSFNLSLQQFTKSTYAQTMHMLYKYLANTSQRKINERIIMKCIKSY